MFSGLTAAESYLIEFKGDTAITAEQKHQEPSNLDKITGAFLGETIRTSEEARNQRTNEIKQKQRQLQQHISNEHNGKIISNYTNVFNGAAVNDLSEKEAQKLKELEIVENVVKNRKIETQMDDARDIVGAEEVWEKQTGEENLTGSGTSIAIIDTGVDYTHESLGDCSETWEEGTCEKVPKGYNFVDDSEDPADDRGHGTHVAGIASGEGDVQGIAPDSEIFAYKSLDEEGTGDIYDIMDGIEQAVDDDADVMVLSLGADGGDPDDILSGAVDEAVQDGVVASVSAGNRGEDYSVGTPGTSRKAITVGATDKEDNLASFSSKGPVEWDDNNMILKPSIVAPGVDIISADLDGGKTSADGTSMSAPIVGGAAALMIQKQDEWTPNQVKSVLMNTAFEMENTGFEVGTGRLNMKNAFQKPSIATDKPVINFKEVDFSGDPEESFEVKNLYDQKLEINLSSQNSRNMFDDKQYSILDLDKQHIVLEPGESESINVAVDKNPQEGTYFGEINIKDNKTGFSRSNLVSYNQSSNDVNIDLEEPGKDSNVSGDTEFSFSVETSDEDSGEIKLRLNDTVVDDFYHDGGDESYSTTQLKDPGLYNWEVQFLEDSTVSSIRDVEFEDTGMSISDFTPSNNTGLSFEDRETEFSANISTDQDAEARLIIDEEIVESQTLDEGEHTFKTKEELEPKEYEWYIELESIESGYQQQSDERKLTVNESNLDYNVDRPENKTEFFTDEEINFDIVTNTDEEANASVLVENEVIHNENVSKGDDNLEFVESFSEVGEYEWLFEIEGYESETINSSDKKLFEVLNNFKLDPIAPADNETIFWDDRDLEFEIEVDSEEDATYELYIDEEKEEAKSIESGNKPTTINFDFEPSETREYKWFIRANSNETDVTDETETQTFEVEEVAEFNLIDPINETTFKPGTEEVELNYSIETQDSGDKELLLDSEVIKESNHDKGLQNYTKTLENLEKRNYNWSINFNSDSGNKFSSNKSKFGVEETEVDIDKISPEEDTINYKDREVGFSFEIEANEDSNVSLLLNNEEKEEWEIKRNDLEELSFEKELEPDDYDWSIIVETEETNKKKETDNKSFTIEEPEINVEEVRPADAKEFGYDEDVIFNGSFDSDDEGEGIITVNDTEKIFDIDEGENSFEKILDLENGTYNWNLSLQTDFGTEKKTENREFIVHPYTDADIDLVSPDNGEEFEQEEINFEYEVWSNASGITNLEIEDVDEFSDEHEKGEENYSVGTDLTHGKYEWYVGFEDETGRVFNSETREIEIITEEIDLELLNPENNAQLEGDDVEFEASIETPVKYDLSFYIGGEELKKLEDQESEEFSTTETLEPGTHSWEIIVNNDNEEVHDSREITIEEDEQEEGLEGSGESEETDDEPDEISKQIEDESIKIFNIFSDQDREEDLEINTDETSLKISDLLLKIPENTENGSIKIQKTSPDTELVKYQGISVSTDNMTSENHSAVFNVDTDWLEDSNLTSEELNLYSNGERIQTNKTAELSGNHRYESTITDGDYIIGAREPEEGFAISPTSGECRDFDNKKFIPDEWDEVSDCAEWEEKQELEEELDNVSEEVQEEESVLYEDTEEMIEKGELESASERLDQLSREESDTERSYRGTLNVFIALLLLSIAFIAAYKIKPRFEKDRSKKMAAELNEMSEYIRNQLEKDKDFPRRYKALNNIEKAEQAIQKGKIEEAAVPLKNAEKILKEEKGKEF